MRIRKDLTEYGYSTDKRKRRRQHRDNAKRATELNYMQWHLYNARYLGR